MGTPTPIENLAQVATRWQDTMLSLEKGVRTGAGSSENRRSTYRDIGKFQCIHRQG